MPTKLDYLLRGCANGHPVQFKGTGSIGGRRLRFGGSPAETALDFDHSLVVAACLDPLIAVAAGLVKTQPLVGLVARTRVDVLGEGGVAVGTLVVLTAVEHRKGRVTCRAQLAEANVAMEIGETVTSVEARTLHLLPMPDCSALASATMASTSRGREITLLATTRIDAVALRENLTLPPFRIRRVRQSIGLLIAFAADGSMAREAPVAERIQGSREPLQRRSHPAP